MRRLAAETQRPVSFLLFENDPTATPWRRLLELTEAAVASGAPLVPQIANRPFGMLVGHQTVRTPSPRGRRTERSRRCRSRSALSN
jgi:N-acyl-D-amino-acid deacylase